MIKPKPDRTEPAVEGDEPVSPEEERIIRERLATFDEDVKTARPAEDVLAQIRRRYPAP